jgi:hypothetical protein
MVHPVDTCHEHRNTTKKYPEDQPADDRGIVPMATGLRTLSRRHSQNCGTKIVNDRLGCERFLYTPVTHARCWLGGPVMSLLNVVPESVTAAAGNLQDVGSALKAATTAAAAQTTAIAAPAADEVSAAITALFGAQAQEFQALSANAAAFHDRFVNLMSGGAAQYAGAEAANAAQTLTDAPITTILSDLSNAVSFVEDPVGTLKGLAVDKYLSYIGWNTASDYHLGPDGTGYGVEATATASWSYNPNQTIHALVPSAPPTSLPVLGLSGIAQAHNNLQTGADLIWQINTPLGSTAFYADRPPNSSHINYGFYFGSWNVSGSY